MADSRRRRVTDPHMKWEAERQALLPRYEALQAIPSDRLPVDYDDQLDRLDGAHAELVNLIITTPAKTVQGALCVIQSLDLHTTWFYADDIIAHERNAIEARTKAVETIRRLTRPRKRKPRDLHPKWLRRWRRLQEEFVRRYMEIEDPEPVPAHVTALLCQINDMQRVITETPAKTPAGAAAQLRLVYELVVNLKSDNPEVSKTVLESVIAFLEKRAG